MRRCSSRCTCDPSPPTPASGADRGGMQAREAFPLCLRVERVEGTRDGRRQAAAEQTVQEGPAGDATR